MNKIPSFEKDHRNINPNFSISAVYGDIKTFDLRFVKPNSGRYMSYAAIHTIEHIIAVLLRNSIHKENIIYFGPMGCRTGFYLLTRNLDDDTVKALVTECMKSAMMLKEIPGATENECGNYLEHNLSAAKTHMKKYINVLQNKAE